MSWQVVVEFWWFHWRYCPIMGLYLVQIFWGCCHRFIGRSCCIVVQGSPFFCRIIPWGICHGYFQIAHMHVFEWSTRSSHTRAWRWNDPCCDLCISLAMSFGFVSMLLLGSFKNPNDAVVLGWNFLCVYFSFFFVKKAPIFRGFLKFLKFFWNKF